jgi:uncharacterized cupredoxin-like copper-binding protein
VQHRRSHEAGEELEPDRADEHQHEPERLNLTVNLRLTPVVPPSPARAASARRTAATRQTRSVAGSACSSTTSNGPCPTTVAWQDGIQRYCRFLTYMQHSPYLETCRPSLCCVECAGSNDRLAPLERPVVKLISIFVCVVLLPLLVACSPAGASNATPGSAPASAAPQQFTVKALDTMKFDPPSLTARAGQPIQVTLDNGGQIAHDFAMTDGVAQPVSITAQPGQTATATFTIAKPGTYTYVCNQPGHEQAGMKGTLTIVQ